MSKRVEFLDIAKGIGILLVVYGHVYSPIREYIFSFHMPLFVFISGLFFKEGIDVKNFLISKANRILVPYFFFALISWCIFTAVSYKQGNAVELHKQVANITKIFIGSGTNGNVALWFLGSLFAISAMYYAIARLSSNQMVRTAIVLVISAAGYVFYKRNMFLPNIIDSSCTLILFFHLGYVCKKFILEYSNKLYILLATVICLAGMIVLTRVNIMLSGFESVDTSNNAPGNYFIFYSCAIMGTFFILGVSWFINKNGFLRFLGNNSLIVMAVHMPLIALINYVLLVNKIDRNTTLVGIGSLVVITAGSLVFVKLLNRYTPKLAGTEPLIKSPQKNKIEVAAVELNHENR